MDAAATQPRPLGHAGQQPLRRAEDDARTATLVLARWGHLHGLATAAIARRIGIAPQTLADWQRRRRQSHDGDHPQRSNQRGRPSRPPSAPLADEVHDVIADCRGRIGIPSLKSCFADLPRSALIQLRSQYLHEQRDTMEHLDWQRAGTVWAADFTHSPVPVDGVYPHILSVRDLASGCHLLAWPVRRALAAVTVAALRHLFVACGSPPLVLKTDNGSHFIDARVTTLLAGTCVTHLRSPPRTPWYNGANEAGIGSLKTRTLAIATALGHPDRWDADDVEAARLEANEQARPRGRAGPTPRELWESRTPILAPERDAFVHAVNAAIAERSLPSPDEAKKQRPLPRPPGSRPAPATAAPTELPAHRRASVARHAIRQVLIDRGYLLVRRRTNMSTHSKPVLSED